MVFSNYQGACGSCERESQLESYGWRRAKLHSLRGFRDVVPGADWAPIEAGSVTSSEAGGPGHQSNLKSIALGVGTGLAVWVLTRALDRIFFHKKGSHR